LENTSVHESYPGHHLQFSIANCTPASATLPRLMNESSVFYEGWALYCEQLMQEQGFLKSKEHRFVMLKDRLWRALRIIIDVKTQTGKLGYDEAADLMVRELHFPREQACGDLNWYSQSPSVPMGYALGWSIINRLRDQEQKRWAASSPYANSTTVTQRQHFAATGGNDTLGATSVALASTAPSHSFRGNRKTVVEKPRGRLGAHMSSPAARQRLSRRPRSPARRFRFSPSRRASAQNRWQGQMLVPRNRKKLASRRWSPTIPICSISAPDGLAPRPSPFIDGWRCEILDVSNLIAHPGPMLAPVKSKASRPSPNRWTKCTKPAPASRSE
jgi:hypothetical protein